MLKLKKTWTLTFLVMILTIALVGVANAANTRNNSNINHDSYNMMQTSSDTTEPAVTIGVKQDTGENKADNTGNDTTGQAVYTSNKQAYTYNMPLTVEEMQKLMNDSNMPNHENMQKQMNNSNMPEFEDMQQLIKVCGMKKVHNQTVNPNNDRGNKAGYKGTASSHGHGKGGRMM